jgi:protein gp37
LSGCLHGCAWTMPDGSEAECYAKGVAEGVAQSAYPHGFEVSTFHPERLAEPLRVRQPAGIFLDSMSDLMGHWVPGDQIQQVLDVCAQASWHTFQLLTKHAPRLTQFRFPPNVWVGVSSPPDRMWGKPLSRTQQAAMLDKALRTLARVDVPVRWMSFEPLSWDCAAIVAQYPGVLQWSVIGSASRGRTLYAPEPAHVEALLEVLDAQGCRTFFKGNMTALYARESPAWRAAFPQEVSHG